MSQQTFKLEIQILKFNFKIKILSLKIHKHY